MPKYNKNGKMYLSYICSNKAKYSRKRRRNVNIEIERFKIVPGDSLESSLVVRSSSSSVQQYSKNLVIDLDKEDDEDKGYWPISSRIGYKTCCVSGCEPNNQILLKFPKKGEMQVEVFGPGNTTSVKIDLQELWSNRVGIRCPTENVYICTKHFADTDYEMDNTDPPVKRLSPTAVPSLNLKKAVPQCIILPCGKDIPPSKEVLANLKNQYPGEIGCCVPSCCSSADDPDISFFSLPEHETLAKQWIINCQRVDMLSKGLGAARALFVICSLHFEEKMMVKRTNYDAILLQSAVPKLNLPGSPTYLPKSCSSVESYTLNGENYFKCALNTCSVYFGKTTKNVSHFPKNKNILKYWLQNLRGRLSPGKDPSTSKLCSVHMKEFKLPHDLPSETEAIEILPVKATLPQLNRFPIKCGNFNINKLGIESRKKRKQMFSTKNKSDASDSDSSDFDWTVKSSGRRHKRGKLRRRKKRKSSKLPEDCAKSDEDMLYLPEVDTILVEGEELITPNETVKMDSFTEDVKDQSDEEDCLIVDTKVETIILDDDDDNIIIDNKNDDIPVDNKVNDDKIDDHDNTDIEIESREHKHLPDDKSDLIIASSHTLVDIEEKENWNKTVFKTQNEPFKSHVKKEKSEEKDENIENTVDNSVKFKFSNSEDENQHETFDEESEFYKDTVYFENLKNIVMELKAEERAEIRKLISDTLENFEALQSG